MVETIGEFLERQMQLVIDKLDDQLKPEYEIDISIKYIKDEWFLIKDLDIWATKCMFTYFIKRPDSIYVTQPSVKLTCHLYILSQYGQGMFSTYIDTIHGRDDLNHCEVRFDGSDLHEIKKIIYEVTDEIDEKYPIELIKLP